MEYRATYRRMAFLIVTTGAIMLAYLAAVILAVMKLPGPEVIEAIVWLSGSMLLLTLLLLLSSFRLHVWKIVPGGLSISEAPRIPFMGFSRRAQVRFEDIARAYRIENGFDYHFDIVTRDGRRFRLAQAMQTTPEVPVGTPDPAMVSVVLVGLTIAAILDTGDTHIHRSSNLGGAALVFAFPVGLTWMLRASLRRRKEVIARRSLP